MTNISDRIKQRIQERREDATGSIEVEEWGVTIYFKPMSAGDVSRMQRRHPTFLSDANMDAMIDLIAMKATDADGEKVFKPEDKMSLKTEDVAVISRLASEIMATRTMEEIEGN